MLRRLIESLLGLEHGFHSREGERSLHFNPHWPLQDYVGAATWNILLAILAALPNNPRRERQLTGVAISGVVIVILSAVLRWLLTR